MKEGFKNQKIHIKEEDKSFDGSSSVESGIDSKASSFKMPDENEPRVRFATEASPKFKFGKLEMTKRVSEVPVSPRKFVPKINFETLDPNEDK